MQEFLITLDIMLPLLLTLCVGALLRRIGLMNDATTNGMNKLIFKLLLPVLLFKNMRDLDTTAAPGFGFAAFVLFGILGVYAAAQLIVPRFLKDPRQSSVVVQALFRTNFAILGVPLMQAIFGDAGLAFVALVLPINIPENNILSVFALTPCSGQKADAKKILRQIVTNPMILGVVLGAVCLLLNVRLPKAVDKVIGNIAGLTSTVSLLVLGASLKIQGVMQHRKTLCWMLLFKQLIIPLTLAGLAALLGFRGMELGVLVILFGAPTAVSSFPMAQAMGGDGQLAASQVVLTTILSMGTLFLLIYLCKLCAFF